MAVSGRTESDMSLAAAGTDVHIAGMAEEPG